MCLSKDAPLQSKEDIIELVYFPEAIFKVRVMTRPSPVTQRPSSNYNSP
jgi:hypothetical protein